MASDGDRHQPRARIDHAGLRPLEELPAVQHIRGNRAAAAHIDDRQAKQRRELLRIARDAACARQWASPLQFPKPSARRIRAAKRDIGRRPRRRAPSLHDKEADRADDKDGEDEDQTEASPDNRALEVLRSRHAT